MLTKVSIVVTVLVTSAVTSTSAELVKLPGIEVDPVGHCVTVGSTICLREGLLELVACAAEIVFEQRKFLGKKWPRKLLSYRVEFRKGEASGGQFSLKYWSGIISRLSGENGHSCVCRKASDQDQ